MDFDGDIRASRIYVQSYKNSVMRRDFKRGDHGTKPCVRSFEAVPSCLEQ